MNWSSPVLSRFVLLVERDFIDLRIPINGEEILTLTGHLNVQFRHFERETLSHSEYELLTATLKVRAGVEGLHVLPTLLEGRYYVSEQMREKTDAQLFNERRRYIAMNEYRDIQKARAEKFGGVYRDGTPEQATLAALAEVQDQ